MAVTILYEAHESPLGTFREAAVYETLEEALLQAAWDEMVGVNRFAESIIQGAHHGSAGWEPQRRRRGRPVYAAQQNLAHDQKAKALADVRVIEQAAEIVRKHYVVHEQDAADQSLPGFGSPRVPPPGPTEPSPSVAACLDELRELVR